MNGLISNGVIQKGVVNYLLMLQQVKFADPDHGATNDHQAVVSVQVISPCRSLHVTTSKVEDTGMHQGEPFMEHYQKQ